MVPITIYASPGAVSARHEQCRVVATGLTRTKVMCDRSPLGFRLRAQAGEVSVLSGAPYGYRLSGETRPVPNSEN